MKLFRIAAVAAAFCLLHPGLNAVQLDHYPAYLANTAGLTLQAPVSDTQTVQIVDKLNEYYYAQLLLDSGEAVRNKFNNRVRWEFHLGAAAGVAPGRDNGLPDYADGATAFGQMFTAGVKLNLTNPKMVRPWEVLSEAKRLRGLAQVRPFPFAEALDKEAEQTESATKAYLDDFWFTRWSVSVDFPFMTRGSNSSFDDSRSESTSTVGGSTYSQSRSSYSYGSSYTPGFDFGNPVISLGTDLGDLLTLKAGYSARNFVMVGLSMDLSTPVFGLGQDFFYFLRSFSGAPNATSYQPMSFR